MADPTDLGAAHSLGVRAPNEAAQALRVATFGTDELRAALCSRRRGTTAWTTCSARTARAVRNRVQAPFNVVSRGRSEVLLSGYGRVYQRNVVSGFGPKKVTHWLISTQARGTTA